MEMGLKSEAWETMIRISPDAVCVLDREWRIVEVNHAYEDIIGYGREELIDHQLKDFLHPEDLANTLSIVQGTINGSKTKFFENRCVHQNGQEVPISWSAVWSEEDEVLFCIGRDVTEEWLLRKQLHEKDEFYHALVEHGSDILTLFDEELNYLYCGSSILRELGYHPEQLIGSNVLNFIHPEDIPMIQESIAKGLASGELIEIPEFRFKDAKGEWRWLLARGSNQLQNPSVKAVMVSSRDITKKVHSMQKLQEREQQFKALFEANSDLVTFVNIEGIIVDVNPAVTSFLGKERQEIVNRPVSDFLSADALAKSNDRHQEAIKGKQVRYETEVALDGYGRRIFDLKKIPVVVNSEIIGAYTIAKDITATEKYHKTIQQQAKKFSTIFESITDAFFALDRDWNFTYVNSQLERIFSADRKGLIGKNIWQLTPPKLREKFYKKFQDSVKEVKPVDFEIYYDKSDLWFQVKAFPSNEGLSVYFDDITERVKYKQELEKLSLVASKTINGVMILDAKGKIEWVNDSFTRLTGFTLFEVIGKYPGSLLRGEETDPTASNRIKERLSKGKPFTEEILRYKTSGEKLWVLLDITPVKDNVGEVINFVALQTDITFRKEAEASQLQLTQDLYKRNSDLQHFSYIISHNLRSPVATARGLVGLLANIILLDNYSLLSKATRL